MLTRFDCPACGLKFKAFLPDMKKVGYARALPHCPNPDCGVPVNEEDIDTSVPWYHAAWRCVLAAVIFVLAGTCSVGASTASRISWALRGFGMGCRKAGAGIDTGITYSMVWMILGIIYLIALTARAVKWTTSPVWGPCWILQDRAGRPFRRKPWLMSTKEFERIKGEVRKKQNAEMNQKANVHYYRKNKGRIEASKGRPTAGQMSAAEAAEVIARSRDLDADRVRSLQMAAPFYPCAICGKGHTAPSAAYACCRRDGSDAYSNKEFPF